MKNIKSAVLAALVIFTISVLAAGCSKKDVKTENSDKNNMSMNNSKDSGNKGSMNNTQDMNSTNDMNKTKEMNNMSNSNNSKGMEMIKLPSMQCNICKENIETAVSKVEGVSVVNVDKNKKIAHVEFDKSKTNLSKIEDAITSAGYDANGKKKDMKAYENLDDCCKIPDEQKEKK